MCFPSLADMAKLCRICLLEKDILVVRSASVTDLIFLCFNLSLKWDARYPDKICGDCLNNIYTCDAFKEKCKLAEKTLEQALEKDIQNKIDKMQCNVCGLPCDDETCLKIHMRLHKNRKPLKAKKRTKGLKSNSYLQQHKPTLKSKDRSICPDCGKSFSCQSQLRKHFIVHSDVTPHKCDICNKHFSSKTYLKEHIARHKGEKKFFCEICGAKFVSNVNLKQHKMIHDAHRQDIKRHKCPSCDYTCRSRVDLERHIRKHTGEKPFICPHEDCNLLFAGKNTLAVHLRLHSGEKPYQCTECTFKSSRMDKLKGHMLRKHKIVDATPCNKRPTLLIIENNPQDK